MPSYPLVYVIWIDIVSDNFQWITNEEALGWADNDDWLIKQTGFLIKETDEYILLAAQINEQSNCTKISGLTKIPILSIKERKQL